MKKLLLLTIVLATLVACQKKEVATSSAPARSMNGALPPGHPPLSGSQNPMGGAPHGMGAAAADPSSSGISYTLPANWKRSTPSSSMRIDQATIPGPAGNGDLAVFFFGSGQGGGVEANLERWAAQMDASQPAKRETFEVNGFKSP
jgi:hypothetical protein